MRIAAKTTSFQRAGGGWGPSEAGGDESDGAASPTVAPGDSPREPAAAKKKGPWSAVRWRGLLIIRLAQAREEEEEKGGCAAVAVRAHRGQVYGHGHVCGARFRHTRAPRG